MTVMYTPLRRSAYKSAGKNDAGIYDIPKGCTYPTQARSTEKNLAALPRRAPHLHAKGAAPKDRPMQTTLQKDRYSAFFSTERMTAL